MTHIKCACEEHYLRAEYFWYDRFVLVYDLEKAALLVGELALGSIKDGAIGELYKLYLFKSSSRFFPTPLIG